MALRVTSVLAADAGSDPLPMIAIRGATANSALRRWETPDEVAREIANARMWGGVRYRNSTAAAVTMGGQIGALARERWAQCTTTVQRMPRRASAIRLPIQRQIGRAHV